MTTHLELSILAMDAYNRSGSGLDLRQSALGRFSLGFGSVGGSFFGQDYHSGGEVVISCRGTTFELGLNTLKDVIYG